MNAELIEKYSQPIEDAVDYIEGRRNRSPRKQWTDTQRNKWKLRNPVCPLCNQHYSEKNIMTKEHIHPLVLGGFERDSNIIPLCKDCNTARNEVMLALIGTSNISSIRKRWPLIKPQIQEFVIWCHASIYDDKDALNQCLDLNLEFSRERKITYPFSSNESQTPTSTKEKLSLWKRAEKVGRNAMKSASKSIKSLKPVTKTHQKEIEESEKIVLQCQGQGCEQQLRIPSDHTGNFRCPKCKHNHLGTDSSPTVSKTSIKGNTKSKSSQKTENTLPIEEFQKIILDHLEFDPVSGAAFAWKLNKYMKMQGYEKCNTTELLKLFGIPKGFKKAIEEHLGDRVIITVDGTKYSIAKAKNSPQKQEQEEPPVVEINAEKELQKEIPSHKIVAFRTKILEFLNSEKGPVNLQQINKKILIYMKSIGFNSNHVTEFLKLFDMPRGLKKAIEKHMGEEVIITGKHPKFIIQKKVS